MRIDRACPSLMKVGPRRLHRSRASLALLGSFERRAEYVSSLSALPSTSQSNSTPALNADVSDASRITRLITARGRRE